MRRCTSFMLRCTCLIWSVAPGRLPIANLIHPSYHVFVHVARHQSRHTLGLAKALAAAGQQQQRGGGVGSIDTPAATAAHSTCEVWYAKGTCTGCVRARRQSNIKCGGTVTALPPVVPALRRWRGRAGAANLIISSEHDQAIVVMVHTHKSQVVLIEHMSPYTIPT
jgi:hypothetical protein